MKSTGGIRQKLKRSLSGPYRYFKLRAKALRVGFDDRKNTKACGTSLPVPPPLLRYRVHGLLDVQSYLQVGQMCANNIKELLALVGKDIYSFNNIWDFGCGNGRVMRYFHDRPASCQLNGSDIDKENISWCQKHFPFASWMTNNAMPPTAYADNSFDFIYAISVFTHLDEKMQLAWLQELKRVSKKGGILILTVHGKTYSSKLPQHKKAVVDEKGILFHVRQTGIFKHDSLPDFYQETYHAKEYIENTWSKFFKIIDYKERAINNAQDAIILENQ